MLRIELDEAIALVERYDLPALRLWNDGPWRVEREVLESYVDDRYEAQRRIAVATYPEADDFAELWGPRIPEDVGRAPGEAPFDDPFEAPFDDPAPNWPPRLHAVPPLPEHPAGRGGVAAVPDAPGPVAGVRGGAAGVASRAVGGDDDDVIDDLDDGLDAAFDDDWDDEDEDEEVVDDEDERTDEDRATDREGPGHPGREGAR